MPYYSSNMAQSNRMQDKENLIELNDRLHQYVEKVRKCGEKGNKDAVDFLKNFKNMEQELDNLKKMYDKELDNKRRDLEEANRDKNNAEAKAEKNKRAADDFEDRFQAQAGKNDKLMNDMELLKKKIIALEREIADLKCSQDKPKAALNKLHNEVSRANGKADELARQHAEEQAKRKQEEDKVKQLEKQKAFDDSVNAQKLKDANERLNKAADIIRDMEGRNKELEKQHGTMPQIMEEMRRKMDEEIKKYKAETEEAHNKNMAELKGQLDKQLAGVKELRAANAQLQRENAKLKDKIRELEGKCRELERTKGALEEDVNNERKRGNEAHRGTDKKLKDLQDLLYQKMQEGNADKDANVCLRQEIHSMQSVLSLEEARMRSEGIKSGHGKGSHGQGSHEGHGSHGNQAYVNSNENSAADAYRPGASGSPRMYSQGPNTYGGGGRPATSGKQNYMYGSNDMNRTGSSHGRMNTNKANPYQNQSGHTGQQGYQSLQLSIPRTPMKTEYQNSYMPGGMGYRNWAEMRTARDQQALPRLG